MNEPKPAPKGPHNLILEDRKKLSVTGIRDVDSFDEETVVADTELGQMTLRGEGLHIDRLSTETGEMTVTGRIHLVAYTDDRPKTGGWKRLFR